MCPIIRVEPSAGADRTGIINNEATPSHRRKPIAGRPKSQACHVTDGKVRLGGKRKVGIRPKIFGTPVALDDSTDSISPVNVHTIGFYCISIPCAHTIMSLKKRSIKGFQEGQSWIRNTDSGAASLAALQGGNRKRSAADGPAVGEASSALNSVFELFKGVSNKLASSAPRGPQGRDIEYPSETGIAYCVIPSRHQTICKRSAKDGRAENSICNNGARCKSLAGKSPMNGLSLASSLAFSLFSPPLIALLVVPARKAARVDISSR
ncbi:hypothetical protein EDB81DRAFT_17926 [Dactylonectria macrodidyma]|uniref:Uncharacterized protein n=1 Tax=Dactylonectria macrodidyma TaxID=307937 RepID=A0A9P9JIM1_9HYPO|nr:hypothetical protein EDB81DRAFT_17926 [Dactylonectria macrodidyma]